MASLYFQPRYLSNGRRTFTASAAIAQGQLVALSGPWTVAPATTATAAWVGTAMTNAAVGQELTVFRGGTQSLLAAGTITAGAAVVAGTTSGTSTPGAVATIGSDTTYDQVVGLALTSATDGNAVDVQMVA